MFAPAGAERTGLVFIDSYGHRRDYTFAEMAEQSQRYAAVLRALGVREGERAALCTSNGARCLFLLLALQRLGAFAVPCGESLSFEEVAALIEASGAGTVIANRTRRPQLDALLDALPPSTLFVLLGDEGEGWARMDTLAAAAKPYEGFALQRSPEIEAAAELLQAGEDDRVWATLPFAGPAWAAFAQAPLWTGASCVLHERAFEAGERFELIRELDVTVLCQPAAEYERLLELPALPAFRRTRLRRCIAFGGDERLAQRWRLATGKTLEAGTNSQWNLVDSHSSPPTR